MRFGGIVVEQIELRSELSVITKNTGRGVGDAAPEVRIPKMIEESKLDEKTHAMSEEENPQVGGGASWWGMMGEYARTE